MWGLTFLQQPPAAWDAAHVHLEVERGVQQQHRDPQRLAQIWRLVR
jgi:hypothetical protein